MTAEHWAWFTALSHLAEDAPRRWTHVQGVARRAREIAGILPEHEQPLLVQAAWLHDIGYSEHLAETGFHPIDGARFLRRQGVAERVCALVAHHSGAWAVAEVLGLGLAMSTFVDERTLLRDALWYCDSTTGPGGEAVTFEDRIAEVRKRRGWWYPSVRALPMNLPQRWAAVHRVEAALENAPTLR